MNETQAPVRKPPPPRVKEAINSWATYSEQAESLVYLTQEGLGRVQQAPKLSEILFDKDSDKWDEKRRQREIDKAELAAKEAESGFPHLHAHSLLGLWGAFECFVEDLVIAVLDTKPELLEGPGFAKVRLPVSSFVIADSHERTTAIFLEASKNTGSDLAIGITKFERQLKLVNLDGPVPQQIADNIFLSQQIRNVWAHRGGKADARFVERCPNAGVDVGERVLMDSKTFSPLMHGLHMYGLVIINRYLRSAGLREVFNDCYGYEGTFAAASADKN